MPLGDIVGGVFELAGRFVVQIFAEVFLEILVKGPGYLLVKWLSRNSDTDPEGIAVLVVGIGFWLVIGGLIYLAYVLSTGDITQAA